MSRTIKSRKWGHRTHGTAIELGLDPAGGKWVVICEDHKAIVNVDLVAQAKATATADFCDGCREPASAPAPAPVMKVELLTRVEPTPPRPAHPSDMMRPHETHAFRATGQGVLCAVCGVRMGDRYARDCSPCAGEQQQAS